MVCVVLLDFHLLTCVSFCTYFINNNQLAKLLRIYASQVHITLSKITVHFLFAIIFWINKMNPVILLSIICVCYLKIASLPKLFIMLLFVFFSAFIEIGF